MKPLKHVHTYERLKPKSEFYRCIHPDCSHLAKREMLNGKRALCLCGEEYILTLETLRLKRPHCDTCTKGGSERSNIEIQLMNMLNEKPELLRPSTSHLTSFSPISIPENGSDRKVEFENYEHQLPLISESDMLTDENENSE